MQKKLSKRAAQTRNALMEAGLELMMDRPIDAIPIDDLVSSANVAKGSFFNHFEDKNSFATAVAVMVRTEIEDMVTAANRGLDDPLARLAGGMREVARYALTHRKQSITALRFAFATTTRDHPLNKGVRTDIADGVAAGHFRDEAHESGVLFWLGLCQALMANIIENDCSPQQASKRLQRMLVLGLTGLGVTEKTAARIAIDGSQI